MDIYIAASWKQHVAVDLLAATLRARGHQVFAFTEQECAHLAVDPGDWFESQACQSVWQADMTACLGADLVIYIGPAGVDAWAEVGAAWGNGVPVLAVKAKGEAVGIQRKMVQRWHDNQASLLAHVDAMAASGNVGTA